MSQPESWAARQADPGRLSEDGALGFMSQAYEKFGLVGSTARDGVQRKDRLQTVSTTQVDWGGIEGTAEHVSPSFEVVSP